ncbi:hypothetical protein [Heyndrickxia acidiproducens]|uniref:hypothetical protein n=1 Tax=Heyndrickxia acidiproducens TaxID=1121084 RepID=UPI000364AFA2|nr:hypothetical protein [Heyndrickxia acidiproducens]
MKDDERTHPFDQMFFGQRNMKRETEEAKENKDETTGPDLFDHEIFRNLDVNALLDNAGKLMDTFDQLKPMLNKVSPLVEKFLSNIKKDR